MRDYRSNQTIRFSPTGLLMLLACLSEMAYLSLHLLADSSWGLKLYVVVAIFSSSCYLASMRLIKFAQSDLSSRRLISIIFIFAAIFRLSLISLPPISSNDLYRYIWDGRVQTAGINPYQYDPLANELTPLRNTAIFSKIDHAQLPTIYPPLAQACFWLAYLIGGDSIIGMKLLIFLAEMISMILLLRMLKDDEAIPAKIMVYLWCPLPMLEFAVNGHVDALGIPFLILLIAALREQQPRKTAVALAGAVLIKLMPIILLPMVMIRLGFKKAIEFLLIFLLIIAAAYLPYFITGLNLFGSLGTYLEHWSFNAPIFSMIWTLSGDYQTAHFCSYLAIAGWIGLTALIAREPIRALFWTLTGFYIFIPTLYPWYVCWIVPLLIWQPSRAWNWLLVSLPLSYFLIFNISLTFSNLVISLLEFLPFYLLLLLGRQNKLRLLTLL